ncbi:Pkinase-domain-containing protein [Auriscalpium vulgare]|uniref:Pkinase-domain-containing protein n=1 Tax=Auriscalpium vulgare TaxID=40419 RepID=A0ACB8S421_9AGAM|nr:Pkinase-domain-containing protein [Auriscalpium vulgare]
MPEGDIPRLPRRNRKGDDPKVIGLWKIGRTIGKGSSGRVRIARHAKTGQYAAVKIVSKTALVNSRMSMQGLDEQAERILLGIEREIVIMKLIEHPNIMRLYDVWETSTELYLILEYVEGGELFDYLCTKGRLSTSEALGYFQQIISAIDYCHSFNIAHRDLKPENLLLDADKNIKVADFGMAAWQMSNSNGLLQTACGSPHYAAPEVIEGRAYNGSSSDIWSCGVILFALLAGRLPFDDEDLHTLLEKVKVGKYDMPSSIDARAQDLITKMLEKDVRKRITVPQILVHPFYTSQKAKKAAFTPPKLNDIARPLASKAAIDPDIFANLRTLWHGTSDDIIFEKLTNEERTWEKGVYHLLLQYRTKHMENYDAQQEAMMRQASKSRRKKAVESPNPDLTLLPPRADPPTPRRAAGGRDLSPIVIDTAPVTPSLLTPQYFYSPGPPSASTATPSSGPSPMSPNFPPTPNMATFPMSPASPIWEALNIVPPDVPEMQDEKVQQFFHQIFEHLNMMQMRAVAMGSPNPLSPNAALSPQAEYFGGIHEAPWSPTTENHAAYQDAKANAAASIRSNATKPLSIRRALRKPAPLQLSADKENAAQAVNGDLGDVGGLEGENLGRKSSLKSKSGARRAALADRRVQIVEPDGDRGRLRRKKSTSGPSTPTDGALPSPLLSPAWFGNLFKFKPASFSLLSVHDAHASREECRRILSSIGVRVILTQAEETGILKCKVDEMVDPVGVMGVAKAVRFRVEVHRPTPPQTLAGYSTTLQLVQEKGALSSFKLVYNRLRREWDLDAPKIPLPDPSPALTEGGRFADLLYG